MRRHKIDDIRLLYQNDVTVPSPVLNRSQGCRNLLTQ